MVSQAGNSGKDIDFDINVKTFRYWLDNLDSASRESFNAFAEDTFFPFKSICMPSLLDMMAVSFVSMIAVTLFIPSLII